ncbi:MULTISPECIES: hypothetical protein [Lelliottia]|uniref:Uncharacterized protein n=1 Tax=Lelliottia wanjuensis TaxID=3050585 RepID=A0AAP4FR67_9ENTR|nr:MULTISPECIES: hypothetical protein [unclassified Lelliottia]MDK9357376.1 hypothetical protein [Lelliottia sp. V106_16]MDK9362253.1 hypothetical protein [Lelliottia sp. V106_12]MDK9373132.1 hypothetical protein [Lelliottia sp. V106_10]MDK9586552.1 hypothetical protein [Lelliottia sp. V86_10]MDK9599936.1 hypothetical protein [Lelliottia sp. V106_5]
MKKVEERRLEKEKIKLANAQKRAITRDENIKRKIEEDKNRKLAWEIKLAEIAAYEEDAKREKIKSYTPFYPTGEKKIKFLTWDKVHKSYRVQRKIEQKLCKYGKFRNYEDAVARIEECETNNWYQ